MQRRLIRSLTEHAQPERQQMHLCGDPPIPNWPSHARKPFIFKAACIEAARAMGHTLICWMDSACVVTGQLGPIWDIAQREGAMIFRDGWSNGQWCTDECFAACGMNRAEHGHTTHVLAGCFALDFNHQRTQVMWSEYLRVCLETDALVGPVVIDQTRTVEPFGHRHDQSVLSLLAHKHGIPLTDTTGLIGYGADHDSLIRLVGA
jgi:hypothetical protein